MRDLTYEEGRARGLLTEFGERLCSSRDRLRMQARRYQIELDRTSRWNILGRWLLQRKIRWYLEAKETHRKLANEAAVHAMFLTSFKHRVTISNLDDLAATATSLTGDAAISGETLVKIQQAIGWLNQAKEIQDREQVLAAIEG
jgi:uncharacterized protein YxjI